MRPRDLATLEVDFSRVVDLRDEAALRSLEVKREELTADDPSVAQALGEAAHHLGYEAVIAPSAAGGPGSVVAIVLTNRAATSFIDVVRVERYEPPELPKAAGGDK
jgi:RES domain-containing protein